MARLEFGQILGLDFGQQKDVTLGDELLASSDPADEFSQLAVCGSEVGAVAVLEEGPTTYPIVDLGEMHRVNRQSTLVQFARAGENA
jgi:hypothetical protein